MKYNKLGNTGLSVSEIGFGAQWVIGKDQKVVNEITEFCESGGINIMDVWIPDPEARSALGTAIRGKRDKWIIQGHIGSTWQGGQYVRTRKMGPVKSSFEDLINRLETDHIEIGMIHYVDTIEDWKEILEGPFIDYVRELKRDGVIRHVGLSTHNPVIGREAVLSGEVEMLMFSVNPAFDVVPPVNNYDELKTYEYGDSMTIEPLRAQLYSLCEERNVGITVMKAYAGGRLLSDADSPFGVRMTPEQCIHYALTRPATISVLAGYSSVEDVAAALNYETASEEEKNFTDIISRSSNYGLNGGCLYCNHCKPCAAGIDIGMVNKFLDLAEIHDKVPPSVMSHYQSLEKKASDCTGCGDCETRCPFGVDIRERMRRAEALFNE